jgi:hypothetical protein
MKVVRVRYQIETLKLLPPATPADAVPEKRIAISEAKSIVVAIAKDGQEAAAITEVCDIGPEPTQEKQGDRVLVLESVTLAEDVALPSFV